MYLGLRFDCSNNFAIYILSIPLDMSIKEDKVEIVKTIVVTPLVTSPLNLATRT